jgi:hypothetical protein
MLAPEQPVESAQEASRKANSWSATDVAAVLRERGWLASGTDGAEMGRSSAAPLLGLSDGHVAWCERAALLLGPQAADRAALGSLLGLVFHYDAAELAGQVESHVVLSRDGARDVLRETALLLMDGGVLDSQRFKEIIAALKVRLERGSRDLFHPIRLALAGKSGEGELDRVILLLDAAAALRWEVPVKSARVRVIEFCSAMD